MTAYFAIAQTVPTVNNCNSHMCLCHLGNNNPFSLARNTSFLGLKQIRKPSQKNLKSLIMIRKKTKHHTTGKKNPEL